MPILYLILGHLIADFLLQPGHLVHWKKRNITGVLVHSLIHFLVYLLVLFQYLENPWVILIIFGTAVTHIFIDQGKVKLEKRGRDSSLKYFILDQIAHLMILAAAGYLIILQ